MDTLSQDLADIPARFAASAALRLPAAYEAAKLTRGERLILRALFDQANRIVAYADLRAQVKPRGFITGSHDNPEKGCRDAVRAVMTRLRAKLAKAALPADRIVTANGIGYLWRGDAPADE